ncbi:hypothetical protein [Mycobacterium camsae]|uniref:hypothetical protein n=1 Tax=Mycobacterium gordonae TaxID=1778 RepID=UPI00197D9BA9|nr:hypothetical protein [Mycobacterium gordonae]
MYRSEIDDELADDEDVFVGEPHAVMVRKAPTQATNVKAEGTRGRFTGATLQSRFR